MSLTKLPALPEVLQEYQSLNCSTSLPISRIFIDGKFLAAAGDTFFVRGVTYGAFQPDGDGREYADEQLVEWEFTQMAALGINTVRIPHTVPPRSLLDIAARHGLRVMVGLSAEQSVGYLIDGKLPGDFERCFRTKVRVCAGHPALLCFALGNEIMASQARWLGRRRVTRYLQSLYKIVKEEDPQAIVTYVNYPTTEYLDLPFLAPAARSKTGPSGSPISTATLSPPRTRCARPSVSLRLHLLWSGRKFPSWSVPTTASAARLPELRGDRRQ